jgi:hypothetical protein
MTTTPINIFQRLMRKWDAVHPYNAAQAMLIVGEPDQAKLTTAWRDALGATGVGRVRVSGRTYGFEPVNDSTITFDNCRGGAGCFAAHISRELDHPFGEGDVPFRPFVILHPDGFYAGVVYHHWIADSISIRMLLREWFVRVFDPAAARSKPLRLPKHGYWNTIGPNRGGWDVAGSTLSMIRRHTRLRRAKKVASTALADHRTRFALFPAAEGLIPRVRAFATSRGVKLNDVFLAALAEACAAHVPLQPRPSRRDVAVGSIVNLRPFCPDDLSDTFGLLLGFTNVVCQPYELENFDRLLRVVASQTKLQKETGVAPASLIWMGAAMSIGLLSRPDELYHFYRKELPLAGGVSNVDMSHSWAAKYHPRPLLDYIRVSPSGPMTPLVVTTTTLGEKFHIGLTHRLGLIPPETAAAVAGAFLSRVSSVANA